MFAKNLKITIAHLYPKLLNIYGDRGNIITLVNRCKWRNIEVAVDSIDFTGMASQPLGIDASLEPLCMTNIRATQSLSRSNAAVSDVSLWPA